MSTSGTTRPPSLRQTSLTIPLAVLRAGAALCFIGHGAFGVITKADWLPYFAAAGIGPEAAYRLMPLIGVVDILAGIALLLSPRPVILLYMVVWAAWTALLRPLAGEPVWETFERAGNYGVPLALLILAGGVRSAWFRPLAPSTPHVAPAADAPAVRRCATVLHASTVLLLAGHGALGAFTQKPLLAAHYAAIGLPGDIVPFVGVFELFLATGVAASPHVALLGFVLVWKLATEALFPIAGAPWWEFIERSGSYAAPLALLLLVRSGALARAAGGSARAAVRERRGVVAGAAAACALVLATPSAVHAGRQEPEDPARLLERLREGGYVLAFRHAITDRSNMRGRRDDVSDRSTQRNLSAEGIEQARRLGAAIAELGVPIGDVLASPYARTSETAQLAFGRVSVEEALFRPSSPALAGLFSEPPAPGGNRVLVTHQFVLLRVLPSFRPGQIAEGDFVVIEPLAEAGFRVLGQLTPADWDRLLQMSRIPAPGARYSHEQGGSNERRKWRRGARTDGGGRHRRAARPGGRLRGAAARAERDRIDGDRRRRPRAGAATRAGVRASAGQASRAHR